MTRSNASPSALARLIDGALARRPLRAGSLIITVYGDAIAPRGGALTLKSLQEIMSQLRVEPGAVRTALSRLVAEGWLDRQRGGGSSSYSLSASGSADFAAATWRIYHSAPRPWSGELTLAVIREADQPPRAEVREALAAHGFGQLAANVMLRPQTAEPEARPAYAPSDLVWLTARVSDAQDARALARQCWDLDAIARRYQAFIAAFGPALADLQRVPDDATAFQLRILLIHEYRRAILKDPLLPEEMLPSDWPGAEARRLTAALYELCRVGSERWLDAAGANADGTLPDADASFAARFG